MRVALPWLTPVCTLPADESDEVRALRTKYGSKLATAKELFPDWTDEDVLHAIHEASGDVEVAIVRMAEGAPALSPPSCARRRPRRGHR